jgi:hypothetical protein
VKPLHDKSGASVDYYGIFGQEKLLYLVREVSEKVLLATGVI